MTPVHERPGIVVHAQVVIDQPINATRIIYHAGTRKYFRLGLREAAFLEALDGSADQARLSADNSGGFSPAEVEYLLDWFAAQQLTGNGLVSAEPGTTLMARLLRLLSGADQWRFHVVDPNRILDRHLKLVHSCFSRLAMLVYLLILLFPATIFIGWPERMHMPVTDYTLVFSVWHWISLYVAMLMMIAVHEMAHAVACKHFGGEVHRIGVMLMYLQPVVYCDVSASWRFKTVESKLAVAAAGIFVQMLVSCCALSIWALGGSDLLLYFAGINAGVATLNFFPLIKLDGYWMLVHLIDEPNLRQKSLQTVDQIVRRVLRRGNTSRLPVHAGLLGFGLASIGAMMLFWGMGLYTMHRYFIRLPTGLATAATIFVAGFLLYRAALAVRTYVRSLNDVRRP